MKVLVISDSHGNIANLKHVMEFAKKINAGVVIHCGDWSNLAAVETVASYKIPVYSVLGNADIDPKMGKKFERVYLEFELGGKRIGVIHNIKNLEPGMQNPDILFCGHNHKQGESVKDGLRIVNPGALENDINFAVYDTISGEVEFFNDGIKL